MNLYVTVSAACVLRVLVVRWTTRLVSAHTMVNAVARQAQVVYGTELQHPRISRTVRHVTGHAAVSLDRSVFECKWTLLIGVTLEAGGVSADR